MVKLTSKSSTLVGFTLCYVLARLVTCILFNACTPSSSNQVIIAQIFLILTNLSLLPSAMSSAMSKPLSEYRQPHLLGPLSARQKEWCREVVCLGNVCNAICALGLFAWTQLLFGVYILIMSHRYTSDTPTTTRVYYCQYVDWSNRYQFTPAKSMQRHNNPQA